MFNQWDESYQVILYAAFQAGDEGALKKDVVSKLSRDLEIPFERMIDQLEGMIEEFDQKKRIRPGEFRVEFGLSK